MAVELAAVWINPYTIEKSRTGGVIARLLSLCPHELVAARMFSPSRELVAKYCQLITPTGSPKDRRIKEHIRAYLQEHWIQKKSRANKPRVMVLLFKGPNAIGTLRRQVVGPISRESVYGETVRDTYGDYIEDRQGKAQYFEPAVFIIPDRSQAEKTLKLWSRYSDSDGGILRHSCHFPSRIKAEITLVLIKPENFKGPSSLAGNVIDVISRTGLRIIGAKIVHMSIEQSEEFYRPITKALGERLEPKLLEQIIRSLRQAFDFEIPIPACQKLAQQLKHSYVEWEFNKIVKTMTGLNPREVRGVRARKTPGPEKCLALIYQGEKAISKIRSVLGATDPTRADWATIRRIYGHSIMENIAHASDSQKNALREMGVIHMDDNDFKKTIYDFYHKK